jgi:hypothetical protein
LLKRKKEKELEEVDKGKQKAKRRAATKKHRETVSVKKTS